MKKQLVMMMLVLACGIAIAAPAAKAPKEAEVKEFTTTVDVGYYSQYMWRGFDLMDDKAVVQPSVDFNWNGFGANVWSAQPTSGGNSFGGWSQTESTEFDYTAYYKNYLFEDDVCWMTNYKVGYRYYDFVKLASEDRDMQEGFIELAWPNLIGNGFVPRYAYYQMWCGESGGSAADNGGPIHDIGFDYNWTFESMPELPMKFGWDIVYNDGTGDETVDNDWSHMAYGISTAIKCPLTGGTITPGIWYQNSFEKTVNNEDELWGGVSYTLSF